MNQFDLLSAKPKFQSLFGDQVLFDAPLAPLTTLKIGGPADILYPVETTENLVKAYRLALELNIPVRFLAGCSNVLISDNGLRGLTIINRTKKIEWHDNYSVHTDGGYNLDQFVFEVSDRAWADLSFAAGIPGSLGGALVGGAGAFGNLVHTFLIEAEVMKKDGSVLTMSEPELGIEYRTSKAKQRGDFILTALMGGFTPGDRDALLQEIKRIKSEREVKHPDVNLPSAGSFFKNLPPAEPGGWRTPAGKLLDEAGVKGMRIGGAGIFEKHANIIVNYGGATAAQVNQLADEMAAKVQAKFGIELEREVQYLS